MTSIQTGMLEEFPAQVGAMPHTASRLMNLAPDLSRVTGTEIGHVRAVHIGPQTFRRIQFRRIGREVFSHQPRLLSAHKFLRRAAPVGFPPIPDQHQAPSSQMTPQRSQIVLDVGTVDVVRQKPQEQSDTTALHSADQRADGRPFGPVPGVMNHGRLASRRPRPPQGRTVRESTLVQKSHEGMGLSGFF